MTWKHGAALLAAAGAVQASTLLYDGLSPFARLLSRPAVAGAVYLRVLPLPDPLAYLVVSAVLIAAAVILTGTLRTGWAGWLLLAAMFYPYVMQVAFVLTGSDQGLPGGDNLIGYPSPSHLILLYFPPTLLAGGILLAAVWPRRSLVLRASRPDKPELT